MQSSDTVGIGRVMEGNCQSVWHTWQERQATFSLTLTELAAWTWEQIAQEQNITDNSMLAAFLLRHYEQTRSSVIQTVLCMTCSNPLSQYCSSCFSLTSKQQNQASRSQTAECVNSSTLHEANQDGLPSLSTTTNEVDTNSKIGDVSSDKHESLDKTSSPNENVENHVPDYDDDTCDEYLTKQSLESEEVKDIKYEEDNTPETEKQVLRKENGFDTPGQLEIFTCDICLRFFFDPDQLVMHMQGHSDHMLHECGECKARFFQSDILKLHMKSHSQQKKYRCDQCSATYTRVENLTKHKAHKHQCRAKKRKQCLEQPSPTLEVSDGSCSQTPDKSGIQKQEKKVADLGLNQSDQQRVALSESEKHIESEKPEITVPCFPGNEHISETSGARFSCSDCGKDFLQKHHLERHTMTHTGEKRFGCQQCGAAFAQLRGLVTHTHSHYSHKPFLCGHCHKSFTTLSYLTKHVCKQSSEKLQCRTCGEKFSTSSELILHSRLHQKNTRCAKGKTSETGITASVITANECQEHPISRKTRSGSMKCKTDIKKLKGSSQKEIAVRSSRTKANNISKIAVALDQKPSPTEGQDEKEKQTHPHCCQVCGARFMFLNHLTRHQQDHTGENAFKCSQCKVSCRSLARLAFHMRSHNASKDFPCQYCGKILRSVYTLKEHLRSHTGERPFKCNMCGACFTLSSTYKNHLRTHTGDRPYLCPHCGKSFVRSSNLSVHIRACTGEKPYTCSVCGKSFSDVGYYKKHVNNHAGIRPYKCEYCGKAFAQSTSLKLHIRIHTGEKPYKCTQCPMAFAIPNGLREHMRKHTGDKPYKCSVCGKGFAKSCNRLAHFRTHSKNKLTGIPEHISSVVNCV